MICAYKFFWEGGFVMGVFKRGESSEQNEAQKETKDATKDVGDEGQMNFTRQKKWWEKEGVQYKPLKTSFTGVKYLGGLPEDPKPHSLEGNMWADEERIGLGTLSAKKQVVMWKDCKGVTVDGGQVAKSKVGAELAFGIFGGLGAKGATDRAFITIYRKDGAAALFQIEKKSPQAVRGQLTALLAKVGVPFLDGPVQAQDNSSGVSMADELSKLAALKEQGILTPEEFEKQKAKLLS